MISVAEHLATVLAAARPLPAAALALADAQGCVLAEDVVSRVPLPGFDNSAMDGYAVRAAETEHAGLQSPVVIAVEGDIPAGDRRTRTLPPRRAYRIMTGAPMPAGADAVVPVEDTDHGAARVRIHAPTTPGRFVRSRGEDIQPGEVVLPRGALLGPRQLAVLAAVGVASPRAHPRPRVVVVSTGDELVEPGTTAGFGQVVDSNGVMLAAAVRDLGGQPFRVSGVRDDERSVLRTLEAQLVRADLLITTGGVSAGAYDAVKAALSRLGTVRFCHVAMQPGKPQGFGTLGHRSVPVFTLPGNPVSALVSFQVFVAPVLRVMAGRPVAEPPAMRVVAGQDWTSPAGKQQYARVRLTGDGASDGVGPSSAAGLPVAVLTGHQGSHVLGGLADADALAVVPPEVTRVTAGEELDCLPLTHIGLLRGFRS